MRFELQVNEYIAKIVAYHNYGSDLAPATWIQLDKAEFCFKRKYGMLFNQASKLM